MAVHTIVTVDYENDIPVPLTFQLDFEPHVGDWKLAVKEAVAEFLGTPSGRDAYEDTAGYFNWGDFFDYVPNDICEKHGFRKLGDVDGNVSVVEHDEQLDTLFKAVKGTEVETASAPKYFVVEFICKDGSPYEVAFKGMRIPSREETAVFHKDLMEKEGFTSKDIGRIYEADELEVYVGYDVEHIDSWPVFGA